MKRGTLETAMLNLFKGSVDYKEATAADRAAMRKQLKECRELDNSADPETLDFFAQFTDAFTEMRK